MANTTHDHEPPGPVHEVVRALVARREAGSLPGARPDGLRIALAIEGGGMRGVISAGMALALDELALLPTFDAVYGASAGAITGAWLLSRPDGLRGWTEPTYARTLIRKSAMLRGRPVADIRALIEDLYQTEFPMDFDAVLSSPIEFHPLATDAATGQSTDLRPLIATPADLRLALRASAALPLLAGPAVTFAGRRFYDAGVSESVPYRTALAQGATHLLVLRSRRAPIPEPDPLPSNSSRSRTFSQSRRSSQSRTARASRMSRLLARTTLRRETPALRAAFLARESRLAADDELLTAYESASRTRAAKPAPAANPAPPAVFSIRPAADSPLVSRLATDATLLQAALESGHAATLAAFPVTADPGDGRPQ